jgi:glutathione S-transferase
MFEVKKAPFTDLNPNGRTPVIVDHNNDDFVLWEVCMISPYDSMWKTDEESSQSQ